MVYLKTIASYLGTDSVLATYAAVGEWIKGNRKPASALVIEAVDAALNAEGGR